MKEYWSAPEAFRGDYSKLVKKELIWENQWGESWPAVIADIDPLIGVSIVKASDTADVVYCLYGPLVPRYRELYLQSEKFRKEYLYEFPLRVRYLQTAVKRGWGILHEMYALSETPMKLGSSTVVCGFNQ